MSDLFASAGSTDTAGASGASPDPLILRVELLEVESHLLGRDIGHGLIQRLDLANFALTPVGKLLESAAGDNVLQPLRNPLEQGHRRYVLIANRPQVPERDGLGFGEASHARLLP